MYSSLFNSSKEFKPWMRNFFGRLHLKRQEDDFYWVGWDWTRDRPDKPLGWIADSSNRKAPVAHITFLVELVKGQVSISYLESYENSGILEVWLSFIDKSLLEGVHAVKPPVNSIQKAISPIEKDPNYVYCCEITKDKRAIYPHIWV